MKILLLFPPQADITHPYLALPALSAYLKQQGFDNVIQRDLNIEFHNKILTRERLLRAFNVVSDEFERLQKKRSLTPAEIFRYFRLMPVKFAPYIMNNLEWAIDTVRDKYAFPRYWPNALRIIEEALMLVSNEYFPSRLAFRDYLSGYSRVSTEEIMKASYDAGSNMFYDFFQECAVPSIIRESPGLIGISVTYDSQIIPAFTLARMIKEKMGHAHITIGGRVFTYLQNEISRDERLFAFIDSFIIFEGERPLCELANQLGKGGALGDVPNLIFMSKGKARSTVEAPDSAPLDLDALPTPDFSGIPLDRFFAPGIVLPLQTSRGCYWGRCAFCDRGYFYGRPARQRSVEKICDDIQVLSGRYNARHFYFSNEAEAPQRLGDLAVLLIGRGLKICWGSDARLEPGFTRQVCGLLAESGCHSLYMGLESGSQRLLDRMDKGIIIQEAEQVIRNVYRSGIFVYLFNFQGFPTETIEDIKHGTHDFIQKNTDWIDYLSGGLFHLRRASPVWKDPGQYGVRLNGTGINFDLAVDFEYEVESGLEMREAEGIVRLWEEQGAPEKFRHMVYTAKPLLFFLNRDSFHRIKYNDNTCMREGGVPRVSEALTMEARLSPEQYGHIRQIYQLKLMRLSWVQGKMPVDDIVSGLNIGQEERGTFVFDEEAVAWVGMPNEAGARKNR
ncbi:MAG: radical SAM protein [Candidatus Omnitrophica bacterium]|nr:radical SAM protein [Candidatus Omnitrophota bacterium]